MASFLLSVCLISYKSANFYSTHGGRGRGGVFKSSCLSENKISWWHFANIISHSLVRHINRHTDARMQDAWHGAICTLPSAFSVCLCLLCFPEQMGVWPVASVSCQRQQTQCCFFEFYTVSLAGFSVENTHTVGHAVQCSHMILSLFVTSQTFMTAVWHPLCTAPHSCLNIHSTLLELTVASCQL